MFTIEKPLRLGSGIAMVMACFVLLGACLLTYTPISQAQSQPEALGTLSGAVRNEAGDPLSNITVLIEPYTQPYLQRQATTNEAGLYQLSDLYPGIYRLGAVDSRQVYAPADYGATVSVSGNHVSGIDMVMALTVGGRGAISVTLHNVAPIPPQIEFPARPYQLFLYRRNPPDSWAKYREENTVSDLGFLLPELPEGDYRICVYAQILNGSWTTECYDKVLPEKANELAPNATTIQIRAGITTTIDMTLGTITQLEGYIYGPDGRPLAGIGVGAGDGGGVTDQNGHFRAGSISAGRYPISINSWTWYYTSPYLPVIYPNFLRGEAPPTFDFGPSTHMSITQQLTPAARITGRVSLPNNVPLPQVTLSLWQHMPDGTFVDRLPEEYCGSHCLLPPMYDSSTGAYTVTPMFAGAYRVGARAKAPGSTYAELNAFYGGPNLESAAEIVLITGETRSNVNIVLGTNDFDHQITGRVTAGGGAPLAGIEVGLFNDGQAALPLVSTTTDSQGYYTLAGLPYGSYFVAARDPAGIYATTFYSGSDCSKPPCSVLVNQNVAIRAQIDLSLSRGAILRGHVHVAAGMSPGDYQVNVVPFPSSSDYDAALPYIDERTDHEGAFEVGGLPPGTYLIRVQTPHAAGDFLGPPLAFRYYPGGSNVALAQPVTVVSGQTLEELDVFFNNSPSCYLPSVHAGAPR